MASVTSPFFSVWASGSIGKTLTCKDLHNLRFSMTSHVPRRRELKGKTKIWADDFRRRIARYKLFTEYIDKVELPRTFQES